jgi:hypothetical protein
VDEESPSWRERRGLHITGLSITAAGRTLLTDADLKIAAGKVHPNHHRRPGCVARRDGRPWCMGAGQGTSLHAGGLEGGQPPSSQERPASPRSQHTTSSFLANPPHPREPIIHIFVWYTVVITVLCVLRQKYGLVGPNGSGKSTLLKCLKSGQIPLPPYFRQSMLYLAQDVSPPPV